MSTIDSILNTPPRPKVEPISEVRKRFIQGCLKSRDSTERYFHQRCSSDEECEPSPEEPEKVPVKGGQSLVDRVRDTDADLPLLAELVGECLKDFEARRARFEGGIKFGMKTFMEKWLEVMDLIKDANIHEVFGILAAKYVQLCAGVDVKPLTVQRVLACARGWVKDHIKDLELQSLGFVDMVNKEFNKTLFFDNCAMIRDAIVEMSDPVAKANLQRALGVSEKIEKLRELVDEIPERVERYVFVPVDVDKELTEKLLRIYAPERDSLVKTWILSDMRMRSGRLALARSEAIVKAGKDWKASLNEPNTLRFRQFAILIDDYVTVADEFDEKFAVHMGYICTILGMCGRVVECQLPAVDVFVERMGIKALKSEQKNTLATHSALELLEKYEEIAKQYSDYVVPNWTDTDVSKEILNALVCVARFCNDDEIYARLIRMSYSMKVDELLPAIPRIDCEKAFDVYFQLKEYLLYIPTRLQDVRLKNLCAKLRDAIIGVVERATKDFIVVDQVWKKMEQTDVYVENFSEVHDLAVLLYALRVLCKAAGRDDFYLRSQCFCIAETLRSVNSKVTGISKPSIADIPHHPFFSDANADMAGLHSLFNTFYEYFKDIPIDNIYGKHPDASESYVLGLCRLELDSLNVIFIENGFHLVKFSALEPSAFNMKTGRAMTVVGDLQRFQKDLEAILRTHPNESLPNITSECQKLQQKLTDLIPTAAFEDLSETKRQYAETRATWKNVRDEYVQMLRRSGDAKTERLWNERARVVQQESVDYEVTHRQRAIERAREDAVRINNSKACVVTDPENPEDIQRAERLLEIRKMNCLSSVVQLHDQIDEHLHDIQANAQSVIETIDRDWQKIRKSDRSLFEEALRLVQAISTDNGGTADEEEGISMMMADTKKQVEALSQRIAYEKGESQRREEIVQFISVPRPRTSCNRARLEETRQMSRAVLEQLLDRRKKLIDREKALRDELKHQQTSL